MRIRTIIGFLFALTLAGGTTAGGEFVMRRPDVEPIPLTAAELLSGRHDFEFVRITGTIQDMFHDDNDSRFRFFIINSDDEIVYAPSQTIDEDDATLEALIGAKVSVAGSADITTDENSWRRQFRRNLYIWRLDDITVLEPAPASPFAVPDLGDLTDVPPSEVPRLGRRRTVGKVLAIWEGGNALVEDPDGRLLRLEPRDGIMPRPGDFVEAAGLPESDIYRVNLSRAVWRRTPPFPTLEPSATNVTAQTLLTDRYGKSGIKPEFHGRKIRLTGIVRSVPQGDSRRFVIQDGQQFVQIDVSSVPEIDSRLETGSTIAVTGIGIMELENWRPSSALPRIKGFVLVPRSLADFTVIASAPWLTPGKFLVIIIMLVCLLIAILIWNRALAIVAERRGKTLMREQIGRVQTQLKIGERTRLAVELHDTISQNLTGISFEIKAARNLASSDPESSDQHLAIAARTLQSCRTELRNCLFELRSQALEAESMDQAIRQTLQPHLGSAVLNLRFNVPRARVSDNTTHALLRIIRELVSNAIRHGHATIIRIAGTLDGERLDFSVADNGCGFDPANRPGAAEGHFGLQGVEERVKSQGGRITIESRIGSGTKITVSLDVPTPEEEEEEKR